MYIIYTFLLLLCVIIKLGIYLKVFVVWITHSKCQICMPFQRRTEVGEDKDYFEAGAFPTASARL